MNKQEYLFQAIADRKAVFSRYGKRPSFSLAENSIAWLLKSIALLTIGITAAIIFTLLFDAVHFFQITSFFDFITGTQWLPFATPKKFGVLPLLSGTMMIAIGSCLFAIPLGLGASIYLTQYASGKAKDILSPIIEVLGGIPTVVYGYFALTTVTPLLQRMYPQIEIFNALSASIVVGISIMPLISSLSTEALNLVPLSIQNGGYALGMRKFHVVVKIKIPAAASGIIASIILAFSRAVGETMAVTLAAGATPNMDFDYLHGIQTITAFIVQISLGDTPAGSIEYFTIYALGLTLFSLTFIFNFIASRIVKRYREVYE